VGNGSSRLAATGAPAGIAGLAVLLLAAGLLLRRRTPARP
jgi:MYXO-CTERM domain-containing protein